MVDSVPAWYKLEDMSNENSEETKQHERLINETFNTLVAAIENIESLGIFNPSFIKSFKVVSDQLSLLKTHLESLKSKDAIIKQLKKQISELEKRQIERSDLTHIIEQQQNKLQEQKVEIERLSFQKSCTIEDNSKYQDLQEKCHTEYNRANKAESRLVACMKNEQRLLLEIEILKGDKSTPTTTKEIRDANTSDLYRINHEQQIKINKLSKNASELAEEKAKLEKINENQCEIIRNLEENLNQYTHLSIAPQASVLNRRNTSKCKKCNAENYVTAKKCINCNFPKDGHLEGGIRLADQFMEGRYDMREVPNSYETYDGYDVVD
ncbi:DgyrCDS12390 [Dimorphilus gyrociliatus]|uniref:DgyrCDS12390 n=1 Tax=Dimorphilus gyrociliatus TaxID=2664684 RepID=A0A7I8W7K1_9ANNE|nr:DgyrCDS12390 [Dimorphilus gyrociliatus]